MKRRLRRGVLALVGLFCLWAVATAIVVLLGARAADRGRDELEVVANDLEVESLLGAEPDLLVAAATEFDRAADLLSHPVIAPVRWVPVLGRQVDSARRLSSSVDDLLADASSVIDTYADTRDGGLDGGAGRLEAIAELRAELERFDAGLSDFDAGPSDALVAPLRSARSTAIERVDELAVDLDDGLTVIRAAEDMLRGPTSMLVLASNNAEMRTGSGMFLSVGRVEFRDGEITAGPFESTSSLVLDDSVDVPAEVDALWGWSNPGREWRNLGFTPNFPVNASMAMDMWAALGREPVDGVMALDVVGLEHLLRATRPVTVGDAVIDADGVRQLLLRDQYVGLDSSDEQAARREALSAVAGAVVARLGGSDIDLRDLFEGLRDAQRGRHLLVWTPDESQQRAWRITGLDGSVGADSLLVGLANGGGSKLDPYIDVDADLSSAASDTSPGEVEVELSVELRNGTPDGEPPYVLAPDGSATYTGVLVAYLPRDARGLDVEGADVVASGTEGVSDVVGVGIDLPQRAEQTITITFRLPSDVAAELRIEPSARVPATTWTIGERIFNDGEAESAALPAS